MNELKDILKTRREEELVVERNLDFSDEIFNTEDLKTNEFLKEKTIAIQNISAKGSLALGKVFSEVFQNLSGSRTYEKFIELNGFNKRTALRHRKRFEIFSQVNEETKKLIATLPMQVIEIIDKNEEQILPFLEKGITKEKLNILIEGIEIENSKNLTLNFDEDKEKIEEKIEVLKKFDIDKYNNLESEKKIKVNKLIEKINKIIENIL